MTEILTILNDELEALNIPYTFDEWDNEIELPQFIGEIHETPTNDEDGLNEYSFILTGYGTNYSELFEFSDKLKTKYKSGAIVNNIVTFRTSAFRSGDGRGLSGSGLQDRLWCKAR